MRKEILLIGLLVLIIAISGCTESPLPPVVPPLPPAVKCNVLEIPEDFELKCGSFETVDYLNIIVPEDVTLTKVEFVEVSSDIPIDYLNNLGWVEINPNTYHSGWIAGLWQAYGKFTLKINDKYTIAFEVVKG